jgi:hypothetical protein
MSSSHWTHGLIPGRLKYVKLIGQKGPAMEHRISLSPIWAAARDDLRARRASRAARQNLERELASYRTPAEQSELHAILDRADPEAADEIRGIIQHSRVA